MRAVLLHNSACCIQMINGPYSSFLICCLQTRFWGKMTVKKAAISPVPGSSLSSGFRKILLPLHVKLPRQAENDRVEHFRYDM